MTNFKALPTTNFMKTVLLTYLLLFSGTIFSQQDAIELIDFEQKVRVNTRDLKDAELMNARTSCAGEVNIAFSDEKFSGGCAGTIERTYTLSDGCNNSAEAVLYITLVDDTPPVFQHAPEDVTLASRSDLRNPETLVAFDETGGDVMITVDENINFDDPDFVFVYRTWTASDMCDNKATAHKTIKIPRASPSEGPH